MVLSCTHLAIIQIRTQFSFRWNSSTTGLIVGNSRCKTDHHGAIAICPTFSFDTSRMPLVDNIIDIGMDTTSKLTYFRRISSLSAKGISRSVIIRRSIYSRSITICRLAFIKFLHPILEHSSLVWNPSTLKSINELERVQRNFTGRIPSIRHLSTQNALTFLTLNLLELDDFALIFSSTPNSFYGLVAISKTDNFKYTTPTSICTSSGGPKLEKPTCHSNEIANNFFSSVILTSVTLSRTVLHTFLL